MLKKNRALFLDRDGVINHDYGYVCNEKDLKFIDGIFKLTYFFEKKNFLIFIVTNQSGIGRGFFTEAEFKSFMTNIIFKFSLKGIKIKDYVYCPHLPSDNCYCRKPSPLMMNQLIQKYSIDRDKSFFIGDKKSDIQSAERAKIKNTYLFDHTNHYELLNVIKNQFINAK